MSVDPGFRVRSRADDRRRAARRPRIADGRARQAFYQRGVCRRARAARTSRRSAPPRSTPLTGNNWTTPFERTDRPAGRRRTAARRRLAAGVGRVLRGAPDSAAVRAACSTSATARLAPPTVIVSEAIEKRFFGGESAVGQHLRIGPEPGRDRRRRRRHPAGGADRRAARGHVSARSSVNRQRR